MKFDAQTSERELLEALLGGLKDLRDDLEDLRVAVVQSEAMRFRDACRVFGLSRGTLQSWISRGSIASAKVGGCAYVFRTDLERWIRAHRGAP